LLILSVELKISKSID